MYHSGPALSAALNPSSSQKLCRSSHHTRSANATRHGAAPRFGIYLNCAGRGSSLYGKRDVDLKILKARLGELPLAGMQSSFEVSEVGGKPSLQLYTGVLGLFTSPS